MICIIDPHPLYGRTPAKAECGYQVSIDGCCRRVDVHLSLTPGRWSVLGAQLVARALDGLCRTAAEEEARR